MNEQRFDHVLRSGHDVSTLLSSLSALDRQDTVFVTATGTVSSRRELKNVIFLMVNLTEDIQATDGQVQLVIDATALGSQLIEACVSHARVGAHLSFRGVPRADRPESLSIYLTEVSLLQCSSEPESIKRFVLSTLLVNDNTPSSESLCSILSCEPTQLAALQLLASAGSSKAKEFKQAVAKHSRVMVGKPSRRSRQREHRVPKSDLETLERAERTIALWPHSEGGENGENGEDGSADAGSLLCGDCGGGVSGAGKDKSAEHGMQQCDQYVNTAPPLLNVPDGRADIPSARGPMSRGEYMHGRKQPQIRWFARRMRTMCEFHHVLDIGGGRGDLAVHIAQSFPHVRVTVIDANASSLEQGQRFAESFGPGVSERIRFLCLRITEEMDFSKEGILGSSPSGISTADGAVESASAVSSLPAVDFVVALHACGGLSDLALRCAVQNSCKFLVCPCCYLKTPIVLPIIPKQTTPPAGGNKGGEASSASEIQQLSVEDRQTLLRLAESDNRAVSLRASHVINSARLHALQSMLPPGARGNASAPTDMAKTAEQNQRSLRLHMFAEEYSLRNMVLSLS